MYIYTCIYIHIFQYIWFENDLWAVTYEGIMSHMNYLCIYIFILIRMRRERLMSCHRWMNHVTYESCHMWMGYFTEWVMSYMYKICNLWMSHAKHAVGIIHPWIWIMKTLQHIATHCNILQHTATHCNALQHAAPHCNTLQHMLWGSSMF